MKIGTAIPTKYYEAVKEAGYDYAEFPGIEISLMSDEEFDKFVERYEKLRFPIKGFNAYCSEKVPMVGDGFDPEKVRKYAELMLGRGARLNIDGIGIGAPLSRKLPKGYDIDLADRQAAEFVKITAEVAARYGVMIYFEAVHEHMCDYCFTTDHAKKIMDMCSMENVKIVLDFYHAEVMNENIEESAKIEGISHLHISNLAENYGRKYPLDIDRKNLERISRLVKEMGNQETISIEAEPQYFEADAAKSLKIMREYF